METSKEGMEGMLFWSSFREFILVSAKMSGLDSFFVMFVFKFLMDLCIIVPAVLEWEAQIQTSYLYPCTLSQEICESHI